MNARLKEIVDGTRELRTLPATTVRLLELLDDATAPADAVLAVVEKDPSLTANLLKLCNSAYYGVRGEVATAREALVRLGNLAVVNLAFAASMGDILRGPLAAYRLDRDGLWRHALATASAAAAIMGQAGDGAQRERAFTAGLVHDIGKLVLNRPLREQLDQLPTDAGPVRMLAAETALVGCDHAEVGAALATAWNLPAPLVAVIAGHHPGEDGAATGLTAAVAGANLVATAAGFGGGSAPLPADELAAALAGLGLDAERVGEVRAGLPDAVADLVAACGGGR